MRLIVIGYRSWALNAFPLIKHPHVEVCSEFEFDEFIKADGALKNHLVFIGWSRLIPNSIVSQGNCYCIHPSDLPRYRGGSPIQNQVLDGIMDSKLSLFRMNDRVDAGPILSKCDLSLRGTIEDIFGNLTTATSGLLNEFGDRVNDETYMAGVPQDESQATIYRRRSACQSEITLDDLVSQSADYLLNKINVLGDPYPNAFIRLGGGRKLLIKSAKLS